MGTNQSQNQGLKPNAKTNTSTRTKTLVVEKPVPVPRIKLEQTSEALKGYTQSFEIKIKNN